MKTNYQRDNLTKFFLKQRARQWALIAGLAVLILVLGWAGWRLFGVLAWWSRPLWLAGAAADARIDVLAEVGKTRRTLIAENRSFKAETDELKTQLVVKDAELAKWRALASAWGRADSARSGLAALVISQPNHSPYDTLIIDLGRDNATKEIAPGMAVAHDDVLLGRVTRVSGQTSQVRLLSSPGEETAVLVGDNRIPALATGRGGGNFIISLPRTVEVKVGDVIAVPTTTPSVLGVVGAVNNDPKNPFQTILFRSPLNIFELPAVTVL